jgi:hypothetical protein
MFYYKQFEAFNPVSDSVPDYPFPCLPDIAWRARRILHGGNLEKILAMAKKIDFEICCYLENLKDTAIAELHKKWSPGDEQFEWYFEWDGGTQYNGHWFFKEEMTEELGIPTENNCNEVDALKTIIEQRDSYFFLPKDAPEPEPDEYLEGKDIELFAVLSLWLIADALKCTQEQGVYGKVIGADYAIKAMDAVCYAEQLREVEWLKEFHAKTLTNMADNQADVRNKLQAEWKDREREKMSQRSRELNAARHAKTNNAKEIVIREWEKTRNQFPSAEKAGQHYADWLVSEGHIRSIEPRTVTGWIRNHAKKVGVRFR